MTIERQQQHFRKYLVGALSVVASLIILTIGATLLLTRGLVAPMHRLMRAARAVGAGERDVFVPPRSSDELGLLTHTFNHMTQRLSETQAEVEELPAHPRGQGRPAHEGAGDRDRARLQARAARHPDGSAEPGAPQPAAQAHARAVAARRHARRVPLSRLRPVQAHQRHAGARLRRPVAAGGRAAAHDGRARIRYRRAARRRRVRRDPAGARSGARDVRDDGRARAHPRFVPRAVPARRPDAHADLLDRNLDVPARRQRTRGR